MKLILTLGLLLFLINGFAQNCLPKDHAEITRTTVLLEVPEVIGASEYHYEVLSEEGGESVKFVDDNHVSVIEGLNFGKSYQWTVKAINNQSQEIGEFKNHFTILNSPLVDSTKNRFIIKKANEDGSLNGFLFLDYSRVAINKSGEPIWFMPYRSDLSKTRLRDFKLTKNGTLTYLDVKNCEELTLDGEVIWKTPSNGQFSGDTSDYYHHEFTKLSNGNYMVLAKSYVDQKLKIGDKVIERIPLSIIIEYDTDGNVVWTWDSGQYITLKDIQKVGKKVALGNTFGHMNSFYFDEKRQVVYAGFRDLNCIVAIDKKSGEVLQSYGDKIPSDTTVQAIGFFKKQHAPVRIADNQLILFNNNERGRPSSVQIVSEVTGENETSKIEWELKCDFDTLMPSNAARMGNATPLKNDHVLVNMGTIARLFVVSKEKIIKWQCFPQTWNESTNEWTPQRNYRVFRSSSLYPYYHASSMVKSNGKVHLKISNEGSENDSYEILLFKNKKKKKIVKELQTEVNSGESKLVELSSLYVKNKLPKEIVLEVRSKNNSSRIVSRTYQLEELMELK